MLLGEPAPTNGDLHFRVFGFPVRVHPFFWIVMLLFGMGGGEADPAEVIVWIPVAFLSILVHELGHAFLQRWYGGSPRIVLYGLGGLAICNDCDDVPHRQIAISLAGPLAGFGLAACVVVLVWWSGHWGGFTLWGSRPQAGIIPLFTPLGTINYFPFESFQLTLAVWYLLQVNIWWGLLNLLPIYPLDGGRVSREVSMLLTSPRRGIICSLWISIGCSAVIVALALFYSRTFLLIMFALLGYSSYQILSAYRDEPHRNQW